MLDANSSSLYVGNIVSSLYLTRIAAIAIANAANATKVLNVVNILVEQANVANVNNVVAHIDSTSAIAVNNGKEADCCIEMINGVEIQNIKAKKDCVAFKKDVVEVAKQLAEVTKLFSEIIQQVYSIVKN